MALYVTVYRCEKCKGPVVAANVGGAGLVAAAGSGDAVPASSPLTPVGDARCLGCGCAQNKLHGNPIHFPPQAWEE
jgi:hypothetical protein